MRTIVRFPIYPTNTGLEVHLPAGARMVIVSQNFSQFYLHASCKVHEGTGPIEWAPRIIAAYLDQTPMPDDPGAYIGSVHSGVEQRHWHFFDQGPAPTKQKG